MSFLRAYSGFPRKVFLLFGLILFAIAYARPASAATLTVCQSGCSFADLQAAIDAAQPGDTILLRAGETFVGNFVLRAKAATGPAILIRSDAPDSSLPATDVRLVPVGYDGGNTQRGSLARLTGPGGIWKTTPVVRTEPRAHDYRLQFLEIDGLSQLGWETLIEFGTNTWEQSTLDSVPYRIVLDRVFVHGHPVKMQKRCIALNGRDLEVRNSYVVDCGSFALDAQAIGVFNAPGPLRIINNYLEATTENLMSGGADPAISGLVPSDIEIRRNLFSKPIAWREPILASPGAASASVAPGAGVLPVGAMYFKIVAVLEIATDIGRSAPSPETFVSIGSVNSAVVLTWGAVPGADRYRVYIGSSPGGQNRYVETPDASTPFIYRGGGETGGSPPAAGTRWNVKNLLELKNAQRVLIDGNVFEYIWSASQTGYAIVLTPRNDGGTAPWSAVRDVTFTHNVLKHAAGGINILGYDDIRGSERTGRITIRNNLVFDMSYFWGGAAQFLLITGSPFDITVDHNTVFHEGNLVLIDNGASSGFEFTNNLAPHNAYGIFGSGAGMGSAAMAAYFPDGVIRRNALGGGPASLYPPDNFFPDLGTFLAQFQNVSANDLSLTAGSPFRSAGTDGKDLGVDFTALFAALPAGGLDGSGGSGTGGSAGGSGGGGSGGGTSAPVVTALPGTLEAENFDEGSANVVFADTTAGNSGGAYRSTDVDIEATTDGGGGYNVGWAFAGEWLRYTVSVAAAGTYDLEFRVASQGPGGTFHLEVDGIDKTGSLAVPDTGGWQTWTTLRRSAVTLGAGQQVWRLVMDTNGASTAVGNFNAIRVVAASGGTAASQPFGGTASILPGTLEAENFDTGGAGVAYHDLSQGNDGGQYRDEAVDVEPTLDSGGGHNVGWMFAGEWMNYSVNVGAAGTFDVELRVASSGPGGAFHIEVNGVDKTGPMPIPDTGGWQTWTTIRRAGVSLNAGQQVWRIVMDTNGSSGAVGNINSLRVIATTTAPGSTTGGDIVLYPADVTTIAGNWTRLGSTTGAGGQKMQSSDVGFSAAADASANPQHYFEIPFVPGANRAYRLWVRLRGGSDSKWNDSVWVQFSGAIDAGGQALWRSGTSAAHLVNLEACSGCGMSGWGWQGGSWWLGDNAIVRFSTTATQTIRIQTREDGVDVDQIVLSPVTYFDRRPGSTSQDATIVPKQ